MIEALLIFIIFCAALAGVIKSASWIVSSSENIGTVFAIPPIVLGALVIGIGTSLPEFFVALTSVLEGLVEVPVANAVGSNITIVFLIFSIVLLFAYKDVLSRINTNTVRHLFFLMASIVWFILSALDRTIVFWEGIPLTAVAVFYVYWVIKYTYKRLPPQHIRADDGLSESELKLLKAPFAVFKNIFLFIVGLFGIALSSYILIVYLQLLAELLSLPVSLITLTFLAIGTSIPELAVTVAALLKKRTGYILGNVLGTVIFNFGIGVGAVTFFTPLTVDSHSHTAGLFALSLIVIFLFLVLYLKRASRIAGIAGLLAFFFFFYLIVSFPGL